MNSEEVFKIAIHCLGVQAEQEVCEECDIYGNCHTDCKDIATYAIEALKEVQQYREIGTVEECREAVEKQRPKEAEIGTYTIQTMSESFNKNVYECPVCGNYICDIDDEIPYYCNYCGQAIKQVNENLEGMEDEQTTI